MENGLLDRVEGNANVHRWSEQTQLEKGDSIAGGYMSELSDYTHLVPTVKEYTALLRCPRFQTDRIYSQAACDLILTHPDETKKVDVFALGLYGLMVFPRALGYMDEATTDLFHRLSKKVISIPVILAETFRSLGTLERLDYSPLKDIVASTRRVDVPEENWIALLQNLQSKDVEWRAPWMIPGEHGLRQFVPATHGLAQSEFVYKGSNYKRKVSEVSSAWNKTYRLKEVAISPATTPKYVEWRGRRINNNIPKPNIEGARPMEEYL
ncbi:hypothetical protein CXB51_025108 [Gossypium anomalum]|uniref:Uncharacterized protein n=1 Tax=Gossypium anomalum TaxID=47600 RepID=A0A8J6CQ09_9ROSI|nr:hypothetical protein CXB51_025108 [Gossypium anomalum]